jgi:hypothetical protein
MCCVLQEWGVQQLCYEVDVEPYARARDNSINQMAAAAGVQVSAHVSHTLYVSAAQSGQHTAVTGASKQRLSVACPASACSYLTSISSAECTTMLHYAHFNSTNFCSTM